MHSKTTLALAGILATASAHFNLQSPPTIGFDDDKENVGPCGGIEPTDRTGASSWPVGGAPVQLLTTHSTQVWSIKAALLSDINNFVPLTADISQTGTGTFCLPSVAGNAAWVGQDAVVQISQQGKDGTLYQVNDTTRKSRYGQILNSR
jgi:hypothetical protein